MLLRQPKVINLIGIAVFCVEFEKKITADLQKCDFLTLKNAAGQPMPDFQPYSPVWAGAGRAGHCEGNEAVGESGGQKNCQAIIEMSGIIS
ncbi:MAG: hypothetical protein LBR34_05650 [Prevotella sp.]|jgi:hypothetical protein|nr:hypothetical protein [Prevotella sp.]